MTTVQRFDDGTGSWVDITDYGAFQIDNGVSDVRLAPEATFEFPRTATVAAGTRLRVQEAGTTIFEGNVVRTQPQAGANGRAMRVDAEHDAFGLFDDTVTLSVSGTDEDVLDAALSAAAGTWTLAYDGAATPLADTYDVERRSVKRVFRDMVERVGRIWWVDVDHTIHVATLGAGGQLASVDTSADAAAVTQYTPDDVDTVVNDVTVTGTGGEAVTGTATDQGSIDEYGRQPESVNVSYITTAAEADDYAAALLNPEPDAQATVRVAASAADVAEPVVNQTLAVTDTQGTGLEGTLPIESQTVTQGSAELGLGEGEGVNLAQFNRSEKSKADRTEPGSVYGNDRIADDAIDTAQLRDTAVDQFKLKDGAVESIKLADGSVLTTKLDNLAVTETKIEDDSISTPKLQAGSVEADKIETGTITGTEFDRVVNGEVVDTENIISLLADKVIFADTNDTVDGLTTPEGGTTVIEGGKIETNSLTANQIDTLDLDTNQLSVTDGFEGIEFGVDTTVTMRPVGDELAQLGESTNRFDAVYARGVDAEQFIGSGNSFLDTLVVSNDLTVNGALNIDSLQIDDLSVPFDASVGGDLTVEDTAEADTVLPINGSATGNVGVTGDYWEGMRADAYFEETPFAVADTRADVDLAELRESSWSDPPAYVAEGSRAKQGTAEGGLATGAGDGSERGVELGHMANYVFEVCKAQQEHIADLTARVDDLEARLEALEADSGGGPNA